MTAQAGIDQHRLILSLVAGGATFRIRLVKPVTYQVWTITAVRIMTAATIFQLGREVFVLLVEIKQGMTLQTKLLRIRRQEIRVLGLMWQVAGITVAISIGFMGILVLPRQFLMATETGSRQLIVEQTILIGAMRIVATETFS